MSDEGEDSPPARPRRKIKKIVLASSSSASESDDSGPATSTRKKRLRVLSDEDSESSGSSLGLGSRRKRTLPKLRDSDGDSDTSGWATDHSDAPKESLASNSLATSQTLKPPSGFASDSSEGNSDKCSICLMRFTNQQVGTPQSCEHIFCLDCITEWSRNVNTCPVDRMTFDFIVVRACMGGRVLCTQPVQVVERVPSMEMLVVEDPTSCEICGSANSEDTMLLCDGCDLGFHMECLTPPMTQIPINQWLCPSCDDRFDGFDVVQVSDIDELFSDVSEERPSTSSRRLSRPLRITRHTSTEEPSTSARGARDLNIELPSTSRGMPRSSRVSSARRTNTTVRRTHRRKYKRRSTRTVIIEYELQENGKCPVTKRVKRRVKKRKSKKRQPRTAARRTHVRESVRAKLATLVSERGGALSVRRSRAGVPALSLFGSARDLHYFSEDEERPAAGGAGAAAVAVRPAPASFAAYRQARRKMVAIPSPSHAASAPDILSSILESQTLLHSKRSVVSISANGDVDIQLESRKRRPERDDRLDLTQGAEGAARQAPSYPGQQRGGGGGGWGGGYRYPREQAPGGYRGGGGYRARAHGPHQGDGARRGDGDGFDSYDNRRPHQYAQNDDSPFERQRRRPFEPNRGPPEQNGRRGDGRGRHSLGPAWQPYAARQNAPPPLQRHSLGAFENPLDMRVAHAPPPSLAAHGALPEPPAFRFDAEEDEDAGSGLVIDTDKYDPTEPTDDDEECAGPPAFAPPAFLAESLPPASVFPAPVVDSPPAPAIFLIPALEAPPVPPASLASASESPPAPPAFPASVLESPAVPPASLASALGSLPALSDRPAPLLESPPAPPAVAPLPPPPAFSAPAPLSPPPAYSASVESILAGIDAGGINVPAGLLDSAVRHALHEHRGLLGSPAPPADNSDDGSDGDCPNFSIYSATSVHIASDASAALAGATPPAASSDGLEDLVQGDGDASPAPSEEPAPAAGPPPPSDYEASEKRKSDEYKEKVSKRCPITTNTRNPIKIKLNTPSLIWRQASLYDEEDVEVSAAAPDASPAAREAEPAAAAPAEDVPARTPERDGDADPESESSSERDGSDRDGSDRDGSDRGGTPSIPDKERPPRRDPAEKMTESISETEDERSYTPCLDENRERDEPGDRERDEPGDRDRGIEGLDTEMISEDEGNEIFSDEARSASPAPGAAREPPAPDDTKKKKKKESKRDGKERKGKTKRGEVAFKKVGKGIKERNYRERDKEEREEKRSRRDSGESERARRKKQKRKDLERYDVRTLVTEKRRRTKDAFGRDVSPLASPSPTPARSATPPRARRASSSPRPRRASSSPRPRRASSSPRLRLASSSPRPRVAASPPRLRLASSSPRRRAELGPETAARRSVSPRRRRRRSASRTKRGEARRRRSGSRARKRRRSASGSPKPKAKKKKRARSERPRSRKSLKRKRVRRRSGSRRSVAAAPAPAPWSPRGSPRPTSPRTPSPARAPPAPDAARRVRKRRDRSKHRRPDGPGPSKEVFTSGDNILVSVSFKEQEQSEGQSRRTRRRVRRRRRRREADDAAAKPVAIIDLERSPFRELTPSPKNVIVLSDDEPREPPPAPAPAEPAGPKTPPSPAPGAEPAPAPAAPADEPRGPNTPPEPPDSPDAYDPYEPTRSASASPRAPAAASPARVPMTLEAAQKTNMSADEVLDRRPLSPIEKVMALLQSTRDVSPDPPPAAAASPPPAPRVVLPEPARPPPPKLFLAKPSPIKSDPIKPMQHVTKISRLPLPRCGAGGGGGGDSPYSPGSSDFGDLFEPPAAGRRDSFDALFDKPPRSKKRSAAAKVPVKLNKKKGKTQVDVKIDDDNLKILDDLPSSAVEMQVKSKFLKKLNRQERVVEEVKLVLKPHYNKKHVTKEEYKHILRRAVPKICHNKTGEINTTKIQALVEAYVKKFRKKHKLGLA